MNTDRLKSNIFFREMSTAEIENAFAGLDGSVKKFAKGSVILSAGGTTDRMGLVLSGSVTIENNDLWGNRTILNIIEKDGFFAETYAFLNDETVLVDVVANEDCEIAFFNLRKLVNISSGIGHGTGYDRKSLENAACSSDACPASPDHSNAGTHTIMLSDSNTESIPWQQKMLRNLLTISMHKNLALSRRSFHISPKSVRGRIMSYLNTVSMRKHSGEFDIPFDRQQLADYLNVDRTALSKELGRMRNEGIIDFKKNHFKLNRKGEDA